MKRKVIGQKRDKIGRWAKQRKPIKTDRDVFSDSQVPPEIAQPASTATSSEKAAVMHQNARDTLRAEQRIERETADAFVRERFPDLDKNWQDNPDEMEWLATTFYRHGQVDVAASISASRNRRPVRKTPPSRLQSDISRSLAAAPMDRQGAVIAGMLGTGS